MKTFSALGLPAIALLAFAAPAIAGAATAQQEVALHIDEEVGIPPDRATMSWSLIGNGETEAEARAALKQKQDALTAAMREAGLPAEAIKHENAVKASPVDPVLGMEDDASAIAEMDAACAAEAAAPAGNGKAKTRPPGCPPPPPKFKYSALSVITINDLALVPKIKAKQAELGLPTWNYWTSTRFFASDPAAQQKLGREQAIAKARKEADDYAASLGYHVVRMVRVSNSSPPLSMRDLHNMINYADYALDQTATPSFYGAATYVTVGIDFVIAPN